LVFRLLLVCVAFTAGESSHRATGDAAAKAAATARTEKHLQNTDNYEGSLFSIFDAKPKGETAEIGEGMQSVTSPAAPAATQNAFCAALV
jgi:hypothetical protein